MKPWSLGKLLDSEGQVYSHESYNSFGYYYHLWNALPRAFTLIVESCLHPSMTLVSLFWQNGNFGLWQPGSQPWDVLIHFWNRLTSARTYSYGRYGRFKAMSLTAWSLVINIEDTALYLLHWNIIPTLFFFNFSFCHKSLARVALYCKSYIHIKTEDRWNGARKDLFISFKTLAIHVAKTFICNT